MQPKPWPVIPVDHQHFHTPPRAYGILPFWFLNGELDPEEMRFQLREFRLKGMPGIILHGRYGLETPYIGPTYLDRIRFAVEEAEKLGLQTWIYDEMNWPSGTADKRVLQARPGPTLHRVYQLHRTRALVHLPDRRRQPLPGFRALHAGGRLCRAPGWRYRRAGD
jgi:hypothetical protein